MPKHKKKSAKKSSPKKAAKKAKGLTLAEKIAAAKAKVAGAQKNKKAHKKWTAKAHPAIPIAALKTMKTGTLEYVIYRAWRGFEIARATKDIPKMKYYAEGIDKMKQELARRGVKDKHGKPYSRKAEGPTNKQGKLPKYADGLFLPPGKKGGTVIRIAPISIFKP